ncbi:MAG: ATP-binding protein, partial [Kofleriaceae bacterium]|nr:ATP-binding protein [Kofleriaceae bacterium]
IVNAARHSERDRTIRLTVETSAADIALRVIDQGFGIATADRDRIFERFIQGPTTTRSPGLGLGLSICRSLVAAHGGKIWVESEGLGTVSTFIVTIPRSNFTHPIMQTELPIPSRTKSREKRGRLLVVDDNTDAGMMLAAARSLNGFETTTVGDGPSALAILDGRLRARLACARAPPA